MMRAQCADSPLPTRDERLAQAPPVVQVDDLLPRQSVCDQVAEVRRKHITPVVPGNLGSAQDNDEAIFSGQGINTFKD